MADPDNRRDWTSGTGLEKKVGDMEKAIRTSKCHISSYDLAVSYRYNAEIIYKTDSRRFQKWDYNVFRIQT